MEHVLASKISPAMLGKYSKRIDGMQIFMLHGDHPFSLFYGGWDGSREHQSYLLCCLLQHLSMAWSVIHASSSNVSSTIQNIMKLDSLSLSQKKERKNVKRKKHYPTKNAWKALGAYGILSETLCSSLLNLWLLHSNRCWRTLSELSSFMKPNWPRLIKGQNDYHSKNICEQFFQVWSRINKTWK